MMRLLKPSNFLLLITLGFLPVLANAWTLEKIQHQIASHPVVRAQFTQSRWIGNMPQPLQSSGQVLIAQDQGIQWQQIKPFSLSLVLTQERMVQQIADLPPEIISATSNPQVFGVVRLLQAVLQANTDTLQENFDMTLQDNQPHHWQLQLTPTQEPLNRLFQSITLGGYMAVETVVLKDTQGDRTEINFSAFNFVPDTLTNAEAQQFKP